MYGLFKVVYYKKILGNLKIREKINTAGNKIMYDIWYTFFITLVAQN